MNTLLDVVQQLPVDDTMSALQSSLTQAMDDLKRCTASKRVEIDLSEPSVQQQVSNALTILAEQFKLPLVLFTGLQDTYVYSSKADLNSVQQQVRQHHQRTCKMCEVTTAAIQYLDYHLQALTAQQHDTQQQFITTSTAPTYLKSLLKHLQPALTNFLLYGVLQYQVDVQQLQSKLQYSAHRDDNESSPYSHRSEWITSETRHHTQQLHDTLQRFFSHLQLTDEADTNILHFSLPRLYKQIRTDLKVYDTQYINDQLTTVNNNMSAVQSQMKHQPAPWLRHPSFTFIVYQLTLSTPKQHLSTHLQSIVPLTLSLIDDTHSLSRLLGLQALQHVINNTNKVEYMWYSNVIVHVMEHQLQQRDVEVLEVFIPLYVDLVMLTYPVTATKHLNVDTADSPQNTNKQRLHHFTQLLNELDYHTLSPQHKYTIATRTYIQQMLRLVVYMRTAVVQSFERLLPVVFTLGQQSLDLPTRTAALQCLVLLLHTVTQRMLRHSGKIFEHCIQLYLTAGAKHNDSEYFDATVTDVKDNSVQRQAWRQTQSHSVQLLLLLKEKMVNASTQSKMMETSTVSWQDLISTIDGMEELREVTEVVT